MDSTTEEIRQRADLVEIVSHYVALTPAGNGRFKACCPFHDEKTPSFYVSRDKGFYKCFGCSKSGDAFRFLMEMENVPFPDAKKMLAEKYGIEIKQKRELSPDEREKYDERDRLYKVMAAATSFYREQLAGNGGLLARDYARGRGLSRETIEKFGLGYAPDNWDTLRNHLTRKYGFSDDDGLAAGLFIEKKSAESELGGIFEENAAPRRVWDRYRHRLMFPIWDESGRVVAFGGRALEGGKSGNSDAKYINSPEGALFHKSNLLFGFHIARSEVGKNGQVLITEGYMDAISLHEGGFPNTVATLGTALTAQHVHLLRRLSPKTVFLCFDGDGAGMRAALRTAPLFSENALDVRVVRFPVGDDPDTYIRTEGAVGMEKLLREAAPLARFRLEMALAERNLADLGERAEAMRAAGEIIADVTSETEREGYIAWLAEKMAALDGPATPQRLQFAETAVRRELGAEKKRFELVQGQQNPAKRPWLSREEWLEQKNREKRGEKALDPEQVKQEGHEIAQTLAVAASGVSPGVVKAEKQLICVLLAHPVWRAPILEQLPLEKWTNETHGEIVIAAKKWPDGEEIAPAAFTEGLSDAAAATVGEVMLADDAAKLPDSSVILDWIARVERFWARQAEKEILELVSGKITRGEVVSDEEKAVYVAALVATKRKVPVPPK